jgi:intracellular septation protein
MKLLFDYLPIILFFAVYKYAGAHADWAAGFASRHFGDYVAGGAVGATQAPVLLATLVVILATLAQVAYLKARGRKVDLMLWVSLCLVVVLGGATIYFQNETFIKWKPSGVYWMMGLALWLTPLISGKNVLKALFGRQLQLQLPERIWHRLNFAWIAFFALMGIVNLWVAYSFSTDAWVDFKLFGTLGLTLLFTLAQGVFLMRHLEEPPAGPTPQPGPGESR